MSLSVDKLRCEYRENPLGIDTIKPRFSWILLSDRRNTIQTAYHIQVAVSNEALTESSKLVWDSGVVKGDSSIWVDYDGNKLDSFQRYWWRVKVIDSNGDVFRISRLTVGDLEANIRVGSCLVEAWGPGEGTSCRVEVCFWWQ